MTGQQIHKANAQQSYTLASRTSQRTDQSLPKSMPAPTQDKIQNIFSSPSKKIKTPDTQADTTKTQKLNNDNGLQARTTEHQLPTAVWRNGGFCASYDSFVVGSSAVLRLNICGENRHLRQAAKRYKQGYDDKAINEKPRAYKRQKPTKPENGLTARPFCNLLNRKLTWR